MSLSLLAGVMVAVARPASATGEWSVVASPNPAGAQSDSLLGVSCPTISRCVAVGASGGRDILAEHWNGAGWSITAGPDPKGTTTADLNGVSCHAPTSCFAVGSQGNAQGDHTLIERRR